MTTAAPIAPPASLRVLGIISLVAAVLMTAWAIIATVVSVDHVHSFAGDAHVAPDRFNLWVVVMGAVNAGLGLLLLLAGMGLTLRARWGRTLGLLFAFTGIPLSIATWVGMQVLVGILEVVARDSLNDSSDVFHVIKATLFSGTSCFTPLLGIVFLSLFFAPSMRRWAKAPPANVSTPATPAPGLPAIAAGGQPVMAPAAILAGTPLPATHNTQLPLAFGPSPVPYTSPPRTVPSAPTLLPTSPNAGPLPAGTPVTFASPVPAAAVPIPGTPPVESRLSMLALFGFLLALCPILPFLGQITALILSTMGLRRVARSEGGLHGRGLAIAGIIISSIWLLLLTVIVAIAIVMAQTTN